MFLLFAGYSKEAFKDTMKKVLFLSFAYPYGHYGPSDNCTVRIIDALAHSGHYKVYNVSCSPIMEGSRPNYRVIDNVELLKLPFPEKQIKHSYAYEHLLLFLKIPIYPLFSLRQIWKYYIACKTIFEKKGPFDLVVAQCSPQWSVISAVMLKKKGYFNKLLVLFWDNIYGKVPRRIIPKWFAFKRQRRVENWIASYADLLVSPTPVQLFHNQYGDVSAALGKRVYLEHPSIFKPVNQRGDTHGFIKDGMINILYAGRMYDLKQLQYVTSLLNSVFNAERINLILFFYKELSDSEKSLIGKDFKGHISYSGFVPLEELYSLYQHVSFFIGFAGVSPAQVISKVYDYMCFGKPVLYFYSDDGDVNITAFARYPLFDAIDLRLPPEDNLKIISKIINVNLGRSVSYEDVERLFPLATTSAYVKLISQLMNYTSL